MIANSYDASTPDPDLMTSKRDRVRCCREAV